MFRSELLPEIFFDETVPSTPIEQFQNTKLRAILKFQDEHLKALVASTVTQLNPQFKELNERTRKKIMRDALQKNQALRSQIVGLIVAFLELKDFAWYLESKTECNKRILQMASKRVLGD